MRACSTARRHSVLPIANHKEKDPELGSLNLSTGGDYPELNTVFALAGFGSQIALSLMRRWPVEGDRIDGARLLAWARGLAGTDDVVMRVLQNKLVAYVDGENNLHGGIQGEPWTITESWEGKPSVVSSTEPVVSQPAPASEPHHLHRQSVIVRTTGRCRQRRGNGRHGD